MSNVVGLNRRFDYSLQILLSAARPSCRVQIAMPLESSIGSRLLCGALGIMAFVLGVTDAKAQDAEPRAYSNTPVGLNFLIAGYVYAEGKMAFDPNLSIADAKFVSSTGLLAYVRSFDFAGQSSSTSSCRARRSPLGAL